MSTWFDAITCQRIRHFRTLKFNYFHHSHSSLGVWLPLTSTEWVWVEFSFASVRKKRERKLSDSELGSRQNWDIWGKTESNEEVLWENENREWMRYGMNTEHCIWICIYVECGYDEKTITVNKNSIKMG